MIDSPFSSRLQEFYRILSESEKRQLSRYLSSSYFNRDKSLYELHQFLIKEQPDETRYDKKAAWKFVFAKLRLMNGAIMNKILNTLKANSRLLFTKSKKLKSKELKKKKRIRNRLIGFTLILAQIFIMIITGAGSIM